MKLKEILKNVEYKLIKGSVEIDIKDISYDSRNISKDYAFVCLIGIDTDGHNYINQAIKSGATCIITCKDVNIEKDVTIVKIKDTRKELSILSANLFKNPQDQLIKIGITGTKGKTSTSWMIKSILEQTREKVGIIGTLGTYIDNKKYEHKNTTPESYLIQKYMRKMVDEKVKYLIMETSSTALKVGRINNIIFDYGIFTNLSIDHIGPREHPNYEDYVNSKAQLFKQCRIGILNKDDKEYETMIKDSTCKILTYGTKDTDIIIKNIKQLKQTIGVQFELEGIINNKYSIQTPGTFSAFNATCAIVLAHQLKINESAIQKGLKKYYVEGRCEIIKRKDYTVVIDFAHNKLSIESIIKTMRQYNPNKIITVFGCGGGIGKEMRIELGEAAGKLSDICIITADNPQNDDIKEINEDIKKGVINQKGKYKIIEDRETAIRFALDHAEKNDIILLLGKGHEKYQEIKGIKYPFDERKIVEEYIEV